MPRAVPKKHPTESSDYLNTEIEIMHLVAQAR